MSYTFRRNVNTNNFDIDIEGDRTDGFWHPMMGASFFATARREYRDGSEPAKARMRQGAKQQLRTQLSDIRKRAWSGNLGENKAAGNPLSGGPIFQRKRLRLMDIEMESYSDPVREPPNFRWRLKIGCGAFGTVFLEKVQTREMESPKLWAVKRIPKAIPNFPAQRYQAEIRNSCVLSKHEHFVRFISSYECNHYVHIAMEYIPIGDMSKTFTKGYRWNESDTRIVVKQLLHGLVVMHEQGITHRDLKPENIFLCLPQNSTRVLHVKIGDFGTSKRILSDDVISTYLKTTAGTEAYMAPEMDDTSKVKTNHVDIWSLGCIVYRMVAGNPLFGSRNQVFRYSLLASSPPQAVQGIGLSIPCVNFLQDVLQPDPQDRPSAKTCLTLPWMAEWQLERPYSIARDLYNRLWKIEVEAPDIDSFSDMVSDPIAGNACPQNIIPVPEESEVFGAGMQRPPAWNLVHKIGRGAFSTVFLLKAQMHGAQLPELWAVKQIPKDIPGFSIQRYQTEVKHLQILSNYEWFVKFKKSYLDEDFAYIAMEYIPLGDMAKTFVKAYRWNESDAKVVITQLLHGLVAMHKNGIIHYDLKPENIFLCLRGWKSLAVKIGDFGISKHHLSGVDTFGGVAGTIGGGGTFMSMAGTVGGAGTFRNMAGTIGGAGTFRNMAGTIGYMAPEVGDMEQSETNRVDIWSLGCILYRMCSGLVLFSTPQEVWRYSMMASSPPLVVGKVGFSLPCMEFLRAVLEPNYELRPSAETCLTTSWITSNPHELQYAIGKDLFNRLLRLEVEAYDIDSFPGPVTVQYCSIDASDRTIFYNGHRRTGN